MKAKVLTLAAALTLAASSAFAGQAADYLAQASAKATARLADKGVAPAQPIQIQTRIDSDGSLRGVAILKGSGSPEIDAKARQALRFARVGAPPVELIGRQVTLTVDAPLQQADTSRPSVAQ